MDYKYLLRYLKLLSNKTKKEKKKNKRICIYCTFHCLIFDLNSTYMDGEQKKNMAVTQFEAVDARRCFPCWDEPALKVLKSLKVPSCN